MGENFYISVKKALELYQNGKMTHEGIEYTFIKEEEDEILGDGTVNAYTNGYTRESTWYIEDEKGNQYYAWCFEAGDTIDNLDITNSDFGFILIK